MDHKDFRLRIKALEDDGTFEGYAAVFGNVDRTGEIIASSAFDRTIKARGDEPIPVLWQHEDPAGLADLSINRNGLYVRGRLLLSTRTGAEAYEFIKAGVVKGMSIGYRVINDVWESGVRTLKELELFEVSLVTIPANPAAAVVAVKSEPSDDLQAPPSEPASKASDPHQVHSLAVVLDALSRSAISLKEFTSQ
jgi:hypothetical protein